jgi:Capsule polysaccharide biosynthesis protein
MGHTFYRIAGLIADGDGVNGLHAFWLRPGEPDPDLVKAFAAHLRRHTLIQGSFYRRRHWPRMTRAVLQRLALDGVISATSPTLDDSAGALQVNDTVCSPSKSEDRLARSIPLPRPRPAV